MATVLDSLVGSCIKKLHNIITEEVVLLLGVKEELIELQRRMDQVRHFLSDAERRSIEESAVNSWLGRLRDVMYDADDTIDLARSKGSNLLQDRSSSFFRKSNACTSLSLSSCFPNLQAHHEVAVRIRNLNKRMENISKDKILLTLENTQPAGRNSESTPRKSSRLVEPRLVGKEVLHASRKIVDLVLSHKDRKSYKLAIVGTGGIGKTTLAQKIYNDHKIKGNFDKLAWVCVSREHSEVSILREVLRNIGVHYGQDESTGELQSKVESAIKEKRFFLVLDDVWQSDTWTYLLRTPLHAAATGLIIVTTRNDNVAKEIGMDDTHRVDLMSVETGWELLWKSMNINEEREVHNMRDIGIKIVRKCGCLPLAIKLIARVLACKDQTENEWKKILSKNTWSMSSLPSEISGALYLSYEDLPHHLKQCFVYFATYPEDTTIRRDDIVRMWVAEGFVDEQEGQLLEDTAEEYYYELINRNLLQPDNSIADKRCCRVHDLLWQLACYLSREECFIGDTGSLMGNIRSKTRRISVIGPKDQMLLLSMDKQKYKVRTWRTLDGMPLTVNDTFFRRFPCLRVLDLSNSLLQSVPNCIGSLIHLRLLNLNGTSISCLPESIGSLVNLQTLNLEKCTALRALPLALTELHSLRRLGLENTPINGAPKGICKLKFLNDLYGLPIGDGWNLEELGPLSQLRRLYMINLEGAVPCNSNSLLMNKKYLKVLYLSCTESTYEPCFEVDIRYIEKIFEQLIPPHNLEELFIMGFFAKKCPSWLGNTHLSSVKQLHLINYKYCVYLPPIGQLPNLKYLRIQGATAVTKIGPEFSGSRVYSPGSTEIAVFPKLEWLVIEDMPNWEEWTFVFEEEEAKVACDKEGEYGATPTKQGEPSSGRLRLLPCLKILELKHCPKLKALPQQLGQEAINLKKIQLRFVGNIKLVEDFPFLSDWILIAFCEGLERVLNLPQVRELRAQGCPNLRCVERLDNLQQLWLTADMQESSALWVPGVQQHLQESRGEDLDIYTWTQ